MIKSSSAATGKVLVEISLYLFLYSLTRSIMNEYCFLIFKQVLWIYRGSR